MIALGVAAVLILNDRQKKAQKLQVEQVRFSFDEPSRSVMRQRQTRSDESAPLLGLVDYDKLLNIRMQTGTSSSLYDGLDRPINRIE